MLIKSLSRKSNSSQLIQYVLRYSLKEGHAKDKDDATLILRHNLRSHSIKNYIKEFKVNESFRLYKRKDSVTLFHNIISFSPRDKELITDSILKNISKKFVELRGTNSLYLAVAHKEKAHTHLHVIVSGVQLNGYSSRVSKQQFKHIKIELDKYQQEKYPELVHSLIPHEKVSQKSKEEIIQAVQQIRQTDKQTLLKILEEKYTKASSIDDFLKRLKEETYEPYYRNNKLQGVTIEGRKFRLKNLGYDEQKIEQLNHKISFEDKSLQELHSLRKTKNRTLKRDKQSVEKRNIMLQDQTEQKMLNELENIRAMKKDKEKEDREISTEEDSTAIENNHSNEDSDTDNSQPSLFDTDDFIKSNKFNY